jgi:hypothetical protein
MSEFEAYLTLAGFISALLFVVLLVLRLVIPPKRIGCNFFRFYDTHETTVIVDRNGHHEFKACGDRLLHTETGEDYERFIKRLGGQNG